MVVIKLVEFKDFDLSKIMNFLSHHKGCQVVNSGFFVGKKQVLHAVNQMNKAFRNGTSFSKTEEMEFLIRFVGEKQIKKVIEKVKPRKRSLFVSWRGVDNYRCFEEEFDFRVLKFPRVKEKELKVAIEKTATFWI